MGDKDHRGHRARFTRCLQRFLAARTMPVAVVSYDVFIHVKIDVVHQFLRAIRRVLKPPGSALIHYVKWEPRAIDEIERLDLPAYTGRPNYLEYLHDDQLAASCRRHGLRLETFQAPAVDARWFMRIRPA